MPPTLLTSGSDGTNLAVYSTASITAIPGELIILHVSAGAVAGNVGLVTPTGAGQTWLRPSDLSPLFPDAWNDGPRRMQMFYAIGVAGSGVVSLTYGVVESLCVWEIGSFPDIDLTNPFVFGSLLNSFVNAATVPLFARSFRDPVNNTSLGLFLIGDSPDTSVAGAGYTKLGGDGVGGVSGMMEFKVGEDLVCDASWTGSVSNGGIVYELRDAGGAANRTVDRFKIGKGGTAVDAATRSLTTIFAGVPTYTDADPLQLCIVGSRNADTPLASTVAGGGVTWIQVATVTYDGDLKRMQVFRAMGPLDGTDVVVTHGQTQTSFLAWMEAFPGADISGTNGSGSIVQFKTSSAVASAVPTATLDAPMTPGNLIVGYFGIDTQGGGTNVRIVPGNGAATADHQSQDSALEPISATPQGRLYAEHSTEPTDTLSCTFPAVGDVGTIIIEVGAAGGVGAGVAPGFGIGPFGP